jgi:putative transposase
MNASKPILVSLAGWMNRQQQHVIEYLQEEIRDLVVRMAEENRGWGYTRIRGALANQGHEIGRGTIADILKQAGMEPAPERERKTTWAEFLRAHREVLGATGLSL